MALDPKLAEKLRNRFNQPVENNDLLSSVRKITSRYAQPTPEQPSQLQRTVNEQLPFTLGSGNRIAGNVLNQPTQEERLKQIDRESGNFGDMPYRPGGSITAGKPTLESRVRDVLPQWAEDYAYDPLKEGLFGKTGEQGDRGLVGFFTGLKTKEQKVNDRADRLAEELDISKKRAYEIAMRDVQGAGIGGQIMGIEQVADLTEEEKKILASEGRWEMFDEVMFAADISSLGATKLLRKITRETAERLARTQSDDVVRTILKKDLEITDDVIDEIAPKIRQANTTDEVRTIIEDRARKSLPTAARTADEALPAADETIPVPPRTADEAIPTAARTADEAAPAMARAADDLTQAAAEMKAAGKTFDEFVETTLPKFTDTAYRSDTGYVHGRRDTALDVIKFESEELGNAGDFVNIPPRFKDALRDVSAKDVVWVTKTQEDAARYGTPDKIYDLGDTPLVLAQDGDGGFLLLKSSGVQKLKQSKQLQDIWNNASTPRAPQTPTRTAPSETAGTAANQARPTGQQAIDTALETYASKAGKYKKAPLPEAVPVRTSGGLKKITGEMLTPISSRLGRIHPDLKKGIRQFEAKVARQTSRDSAAIEPLLAVSKKMSAQDSLVWDLARKNGDNAAIDALAKKYGFTQELKQTRNTLNSIYQRAKDAGMDIGRVPDYFPRIVKNPSEYMKYLRNDPNWGDIEELIRKHAETKGKKYADVTQEEQVAIVNQYIRGYGDRVSLATPSSAKARSIEAIDQELNRFYENSDTALATYIVRMNDEIAAREFFGKGEDITESIGAYLIKMGAEGKISPADIPQAGDILKSRFSRGKMNGALDMYRNAEYISTMGSPISAITQLGDLAFPAYENGVYHTLKGIGKTLKRTGISKEAIGIENITQEFMSATKTGKALQQVFKYTGLNALDRLGKETLVNSTFSKLRSWAKSGDKRLYSELDKILNADEIPLAIDELKKGMLTERTEAVLFNKVMDFQPIAKSEMPQKYLEMPNGKILYMLKSFTLKQIDIFRRESIDLIVSGDPKKVAQGMGNLVKLSGMFMLANMGADKLKDVVLGRETDIEDTVVDNLWRLIGASKYDVYKARTDGIGMTVLKKMLFPSSIIDRTYKDVSNLITGKEYQRGPMEGEAYKLETPQSIPVAGKLYYWWFGRGAQKEEYRQGGEGSRQDGVENGLLPELPELPELPSI